MSVKLLLVEDDDLFAKALAEQLGGLGHGVTIVAGGRDALRAIGGSDYDAVILDRMIPQIDGIEVLKKLRAGNITLPVIMLSAFGRSTSRIEGLAAGADDYVAKPVDVAELNARILAVLRGRRWAAGSGDTVEVGGILVSPSHHRASVAGKPIELGRIEFELLAEFVRNPGAVLTRAMLVERVWKYESMPGSNIVEVYVRRLRLKLAAAGKGNAIATVRGVGYMFRT